MSDRKYRQRGYQDDPRDRERKPQGPRGPREKPPGGRGRDHEGPRTPNLMASHEVFRCARCGNLLSLPVTGDSRCSRCGVHLHACIQCVSFDTSARFECTQPIAARVAPKDAQNACTFFAPRTTIERQTGTGTPGTPATTGTPGSTSARQAFDDLFK